MSEFTFILKIYFRYIQILHTLHLHFHFFRFYSFLSMRASGRTQENPIFYIFLGGIYASNLHLFTLYRVRCNSTVYLTKLYFWIHAECTAGCIYEQGRVGYRHCSSLWVWLYRENWYPNPCTVYSYIEYSVPNWYIVNGKMGE